MAGNDFVDPANPLRTDWLAAWETEDNFWHENFSSRPYSLGPDYYERFRPAYRYGFESARHNVGRTWDDAEPHLREGWDRYEHRGKHESAWEEIKDAVRDAWDRGTGQHHVETAEDHATMHTRATDKGKG